jgi:NADPH:quinone reductase-like Zn-dependent oxidoreductase
MSSFRYRDGTLAEYSAVEALNLAPLPGDVDFSYTARRAQSDRW